MSPRAKATLAAMRMAFRVANIARSFDIGHLAFFFGLRRKSEMRLWFTCIAGLLLCQRNPLESAGLAHIPLNDLCVVRGNRRALLDTSFKSGSIACDAVVSTRHQLGALESTD
jgi:hypothetical protein